MTIGEKIRFYRKEKKMSQDELGRKLFVSRQTVSQWETGQTTPSVDNLARLKEILGVSFDDILSADSVPKEMDTEEWYRFSPSEADIQQIYRQQMRSAWLPTAIIFSVILMTILFARTGISSFYFGFCTLGCLLRIGHILCFRKSLKAQLARVQSSSYEYHLQREYILIQAFQNGEKISELKRSYADIERIRQVGDWLFIQISGQTIILPQNQLHVNSALYSYMYQNPDKTKTQKTIDKWWILPLILFIGSLCSIMGALMLVATVSNMNGKFVENMWLCFLMTPIPLASIVLSAILKSKGRKYKKNLIAGIIMTTLLCIYGSFTFIFSTFP